MKGTTNGSRSCPGNTWIRVPRSASSHLTPSLACSVVLPRPAERTGGRASLWLSGDDGGGITSFCSHAWRAGGDTDTHGASQQFTAARSRPGQVSRARTHALPPPALSSRAKLSRQPSLSFLRPVSESVPSPGVASRSPRECGAAPFVQAAEATRRAITAITPPIKLPNHDGDCVVPPSGDEPWVRGLHHHHHVPASSSSNIHTHNSPGLAGSSS